MNKENLSVITTLIGIIAFITWTFSKLSEKNQNIILAAATICASIAKIIYLGMALYKESDEFTEEAN